MISNTRGEFHRLEYVLTCKKPREEEVNESSSKIGTGVLKVNRNSESMRFALKWTLSFPQLQNNMDQDPSIFILIDQLTTAPNNFQFLVEMTCIQYIYKGYSLYINSIDF